MPLIKIKPQVLDELQRQFNHELSASHSYLALAAWCHHASWKGFSQYFSKQAAEERVHANKLMLHLLDRGVLPIIGELPKPPQEFPSLLEIARRAQAMEQENTNGVNRCYQAALEQADYPAQVLLQWFITEQVEEENWADEMVERVERANCAGGLSDLDRHIDRYLSEKGLDAAKGSEPEDGE